MFVRAFDAHTGEYYKSMVYALVNTGILEQAVLYHPVLDSFVLQPRYRQKFQLQYECIQPGQTGWVDAAAARISGLKTAPSGESGTRPVTLLRGYPEAVEDLGFLQALLSTGFVPRERTGIALRHPADQQIWTYIRTQQDADRLMQLFSGFAGASLCRLFYKENTGTRQLTARFDNARQYGTIDLCFEGTVALHLKPFGERADRELEAACLLVRQETVFWADADLDREDTAACRNYIKALNLKWRTVRRVPRPVLRRH